MPSAPDLAAQELYGKVDGAALRQPARAMQIVRPAVPLRRKPMAGSGVRDRGDLRRDRDASIDEAEGWAWVQLERDGYVGYLPVGHARRRGADEPTHRVKALGTFVYPVPDIKSPPLMHLSLNARLAIAAIDGAFCAARWRRLRLRAAHRGERPG